MVQFNLITIEDRIGYTRPISQDNENSVVLLDFAKWMAD